MKRAFIAVVSAVSLLICVWGGVVWVCSYRANASPTPTTLRMQTRLARILPTVQFDGVGLGDVIDFLRDVSGANLTVNWPALNAAVDGVDRNTPVSARQWNVRFGEAIAQIASQAGSLGFTADDNLITLAPKEQLSQVRQIERYPAAPGAAGVAMRQPRGRLYFPSGQLDRVLQFLSQQTGIPISCDWQELNHAGVEQGTPISLQLRGVSAAEALTRILTDLDAKENLQFHIGPSRVVISTREAFDRQLGPTGASHSTLIIAAVAGAAVVLAVAAWIWRRRLRSAQKQGEYIGWAALGAVVLLSAIVVVATWKHGPPLWEPVFKSNRWTITAHHGTLRLWRTPADPAAPYRYLAHLGRATAPDQEKLFDRAGFFIRWGGSPFNSWVAGVPLWAFVPLTALAPLLWLITSVRRWRRFGEGLCAKCGYDLPRLNRAMPRMRDAGHG